MPVETTVLTTEALALVDELHRRFDGRRRELLALRTSRAAPSAFLEETRAIREGSWTVAPVRPDYADRRVEITGPVDRKMIINALNSGARGFMADFEDATAPRLESLLEGQQNLIDAIEGTIAFTSEDGREYRLDPASTTTLVPRPRGWHLPERHHEVDGQPVAGALFDAGVYLTHCAPRLIERGRGVYLYLPKLEHHLEARLWNDVLTCVETTLGLPANSVRPTVLIETLPAAFQMHEILYELRERSYGLNAGRWDYIFSTIKSYAGDPAFVLPDRSRVTMTVPFMHAYAELLVSTCHARGAFAMGGMAAVLPDRNDPERTAAALAAVAADKRREATAGFDGTWVAHPAVVATAQAEFDAVLGDRPNQIERLRPEVSVEPADLLAVDQTPGAITEAGLRSNLSIAHRYVAAWLGGRGAVALDGLMEDAATAEISRTQLWQWLQHGVVFEDGRTVTRELVDQLVAEELDATLPHGAEAKALLESLISAATLAPFLTIPAYDLLR